MSTRSLLLGIATAPFLSAGVLIVAASCGNNPPGGDAGGMDASNDVVEMGPCQDGTIQLLECEPAGDGQAAEDMFTDEACEGLDDAESRAPGVVHDDTQAPMIIAPAVNSTVPGTSPFTFIWQPGGLAYHFVPSPTRALTFRDDLARWTRIIPDADAHCPPFGGVAFAVVFRAGTMEVLRAETAHTSYTPTDAAWTRLKAVSGPITMSVEAARFASNAVVEGPYDQTTARSFSIAP